MKNTMKNKILVVLLVQGMFLFNGCSSDSGDNSVTDPEVIEGEIKVDYAVGVNTYTMEGFVVNDDNTVFFTEFVNDSGKTQLGKIDVAGKVTVLSNLDNFKFLNNELCNTLSGGIVLITYNSDYGNLLYRFENNYTTLSPFYTMKPNGPVGGTVQVGSICNASTSTAESYFVFDYGIKSIKRIVIGSVNTDVLIAGSQKQEIKDGVGLDAGFFSISQMICKNEILYFIDRDYGKVFTVRKMEQTAAGWKVTTLVSTTTEIYQNIGIDSQNNLYVLLKGKGIYKLDPLTNTLSVYKEGIIKVDKPNREGINLKDADFMYIKNDDLYIGGIGNLRKISNFRTKL
jgi:hypothetical protein